MLMRLLAILSVFLIASLGVSSQSLPKTKPQPITVVEIFENFRVQTYPQTETNARQNQKAIEMVLKRCDIGFVDDGTNFWALRTAGANEELLRQVEKCTSPTRKLEIAEMEKALTEESRHFNKKALVSDLVRFLFVNKTVEGRHRTIIACKEYVARYGDDRFGDPGADQLLKWIKATLPKMQAAVSNMEAVQ